MTTHSCLLSGIPEGKSRVVVYHPVECVTIVIDDFSPEVAEKMVREGNNGREPLAPLYLAYPSLAGCYRPSESEFINLF
jgi:hypothetical protein